MSKAQLNLLQNRRVGFSVKLTNIREQIAVGTSAQVLSLSQLELLIEKVSALTKDNEENYEQMSLLINDDADEYLNDYSTLDKDLFILKADLMEQKRLLGSREAPSHTVRPMDVKLPKIDIPKFGGNFHEWESFQDIFNSIISNNSNELTGVQKLHYLKSALVGDAAKMIQNIRVTNGNFEAAWKILMDRFDNKREIVNSHLNRFFKQPSMDKESSSGIRKIIDTTNECIRSLNVLNEPTEQWSTILVYTLCEKLDSETRRQWELSLVNNELPKFEELVTFLEKRARALAVSGENKTKSSVPVKPGVNKHASAYLGSVNKKNVCGFCSGGHYSNKCDHFLKLSVSERVEMVKQKKLCFNCFSSSHSVANCPSKWTCRKCDKKHNELLHFETSSTNESMNIQKRAFLSNGDSLSQVLLATALVKVMDVNGEPQLCRALLDQGSESSFINENCMQRLGLPRRRLNVTITGLASSTVETARGLAQLKVSSCAEDFKFNVGALIMSKVTGDLPKYSCDPSKWSHMKGLKLADPKFCESGNIDLLIGADYVAFLMKGGRKVGPKGTPIAQESSLGWIVSGPVGSSSVKRVRVHHGRCDLDSTLRQFWEIEEIPTGENPCNWTMEEKACVDHFQSTHQRNEFGRFVVELPFRPDAPPLGNSYWKAVKRWEGVERRIGKNDNLYNQYQSCLQEYLDLDHMELVPEEEIECVHAYYIPHHEVIKESSSTTKLRVVFDASAKTSNGFSLNDVLMNGPKLQDDLVTLLLRFLIVIIVLCGDIAKMYRQFLVHPKHRDFQRIVWRPVRDGPILIYRLKTVTFGVKCSPTIAILCVQQLANYLQNSFPIAAPAIQHDLYMDNLLSGKSNVNTALECQSQIIQMMNEGGMVMRQWSSNHPALLASLPSELREIQFPFSIDNDETVKTLGLQWHPATDQFSFKVSLSNFDQNLTKRILLSEIAKLFDPLGWLAPIIIRAKLLMQSLWKLNLGWDETLPKNLVEQWEKFKSELFTIEAIRIFRCVTISNANTYTLCGFCDASENAYAAVVYLCVAAEGNNNNFEKVSLLISKTRVAPVKQVSIPRLELCGALLLAKLLKTVKDSLKLPVESTNAWTDSTVVLHWLNDHSGRWKTFVANRVSQIQTILPPCHWHHVAGKENPADVASRGISPSHLENHSLWWHGPAWLTTIDKLGYHNDFDAKADNSMAKVEEKIQIVSVGHAQTVDNSIFDRYSSLTKLNRISALCFRFVHNCKFPGEKRLGEICLNELKEALFALIKIVQADSFRDEIEQLSKNGRVNTRSKLASFNPFLQNQLLRVGGRLRAARIPEAQKFPLILPKKHKLTSLIVNYYHIVNLHAGPQLLAATLQQQYWIIGLRDIVRRHSKNCVTCQKAKATVGKQMMADLPSSRLIPGRAFERVGIDYAGPIMIYNHRGRGSKSVKGYIVIFTCFTTRAIHLELAHDLTTATFIAALKRFVARRGPPAHIYSDNATSFARADNELKVTLKAVTSEKRDDTVTRFLTKENIEWHFNPPASPHFGGVWEAGVKSVKYHLKRVLKKAKLTYVEMVTLLTQIESCLNSRPLTAMSTDPNDLNVLTPGHFLIGAPLNCIPEPDLSSCKITELTRWQLVTQLFQHFWRRWAGEYLTRLQQRPKWVGPQKNLETGDIVLIKNEKLAPLQWHLGRVTEVHPGADGIVRVVTLKTANGQLKRPIHKLCHLPIK